MTNSLSAKIIRKKVDYGKGWGGTDKYSFLVYHNGQEKWVSAFADEKKVDPETIQLFKDLAEGDRAEFTIVENQGKGKDGKPATYLNIVGVVRETDVRDDVNVPAVQSVGKDKPKPAGESDTRVRSMALSYAKDWAVAMAGGFMAEAAEHNTTPPDMMIELAKRFEQYILTGE